MRAPEASFVAAITHAPNGHPVGLVTGSRSRDGMQLDGLVSENEWWPSGDIYRAMLDALEPAIATEETVELWGKPAQLWHEEIASSRGFQPLRALHQLRCTLPVSVEPVPTRLFNLPGLVGRSEMLPRCSNNLTTFMTSWLSHDVSASPIWYSSVRQSRFHSRMGTI